MWSYKPGLLKSYKLYLDDEIDEVFWLWYMLSTWLRQVVDELAHIHEVYSWWCWYILMSHSWWLVDTHDWYILCTWLYALFYGTGWLQVGAWLMHLFMVHVGAWLIHLFMVQVDYRLRYRLMHVWCMVLVYWYRFIVIYFTVIVWLVPSFYFYFRVVGWGKDRWL